MTIAPNLKQLLHAWAYTMQRRAFLHPHRLTSFYKFDLRNQVGKLVESALSFSGGTMANLLSSILFVVFAPNEVDPDQMCDKP